jgi:ATP-dependent Lhr-like helicase
MGVAEPGSQEGGALRAFHPAVAEWFRRRYPAGPTQAQADGWAAIASGVDTLIAAPTGSGKTLAAFLVAIDRCYRAAELGGDHRGTDVVYVSPLRALTVDVSENLRRPLSEIAEVAAELGLEPPKVQVAVRNGDTPASERSAMLRNRPEIVVTTPESLYLLLTSARGRDMLATVRTVIVDEIHALARDKRGSHLALSLERLDRLVAMNRRAAEGGTVAMDPQVAGDDRPVRIGLSATQRPIATIARLLVGAGADRTGPDGGPRCTIVDVGHRRRLDVAIELPDDELGAVSTHEQMASVLDAIAAHIEQRRTTLVFVNTRRMAERVAHQLADRLGDDSVQAHHGSLSMDRRLRVEARLRAGELRAVVATASLELGIDVGPVELVCQLGSPRSIATFLQRVGRAQHHVGGVPVGRLYPLTRDELVECTALLAAVRAGELDAVVPPVAPLDVLAQQVVAECAASDPDGCSESELLALARRSAPYSALSVDDFESVVELVSQGVVTGRGRRGAHLHRDRVNGVLRPRRGARLTAVTSGGAIPDVADYRVVLEPEETPVGTVNEDWAVESVAGDVFLLGSSTWRISRIETGTVRVVDAEGASPTVPFWLGEAPARTAELSQAVSDLRSAVEAVLEGAARTAGPAAKAGAANAAAIERATEIVEELAEVDRAAARQVVAYLACAYGELGALATTDLFVIERFFDDTGGMQLVVHSPRGARVNRALGLALRKRFCRTFDFELQAAASDDAVVLSLGPQHSFPLEEVLGFLNPTTVRDTLVQAVLPTPMFASRWRWNLTRSLVSPRYRGSRRVPPAIGRMEADDLMAAVFPALAACQENVSGPIEIPDHPIVRQTLEDCCTEAMDLEGLTGVLARLRSGEVQAHCVDTVVPSVLAEEILNGRPYTFLDDAPLEERRTRAVTTRRGLPLEARDLASLDPGVVARITEQARPELRNAEELHDLLCSLVLAPPRPEWGDWMATLSSCGRAMTLEVPGAGARWVAVECRALADAVADGGRFVPDHRLEDGLAQAPCSREDALVTAARGHLEVLGPVTLEELAASIGTGTPGETASAVARLVAEGSVLGCRVAGDAKSPGPLPAERFCARHLLARIHAAMRDGSRRSVEAVSAQQFMRFLLSWQHVGPGQRLLGSGGVVEVVEQLQGYEAAVDSWESAILPARVAGYHAALLDEWCARGEVSFGRLGLRAADRLGAAPRRGGATPSPATPVSLYRREDLVWLLAATRDGAMPEEPTVGAALEVVEALRRHGALFVTDLCRLTSRMPGEIAEALWDGMARGLLSADGFQAVRALLNRRGRRGRTTSFPNRAVSAPSSGGRARAGLPRPGHSRLRVRPAIAGGRWSLLGEGLGTDTGVSADALGSPAERVEHRGFDPDELAEAVAGQLLARWGVVFRDLVWRESLAIAWRDILWALRRLEARGVVLGGRYVAGFTGEQFALPEAAEQLRSVTRRPADGVAVQLSAADPLNLTGIILPGPRIPAQHARAITLVDGVIERPEAEPISQPGALPL